jgi:hypothetical protein
MLSIESRGRCAVAPIAICGAILALIAFPAAAAAAVYPSGGGVFAADAEGWQETEATCNVTALSTCEASGEHDASSGNPPGAITAKTTVLLNLAALFESTVVFESPDFIVEEVGAASMHVDRQLAAGGLLALSPESTYTVSLIDRDLGTQVEVLSETLDEGDSSFAGKDGLAPVLSGHTYAISIEAKTTATAALGLLGGETNVRFDSVSLSTQASTGGGGGGSGGGDAGAGGSESGDSNVATTLSSSELRTLVRRGDAPSAQVRGRHVFVKLRCPMRAEHACRITAQGRIRKGLPVTQRRTVKLAKGRSRLVGLRVKRRFLAKVAKRKRLLVVQKVRAGDVTTTFARSRALIR